MAQQTIVMQPQTIADNRIRVNDNFVELYTKFSETGRVNVLGSDNILAGAKKCDMMFTTLHGAAGIGGRHVIADATNVRDMVTRLNDNFTALYNAIPSDILYLEETFARDANTFVPPWDQVLREDTDRLTTVTSPAPRKGTHCCRFHVLNTDNPGGWGTRADLVGPQDGEAALREGDERWVGWSILFPSDFLSQLGGMEWILVAEHGYATSLRPRTAYYFNGSGSGGNFELISRSGTSNVWENEMIIFSIPPTYGKWMDVVSHYIFSSDPSVGFVELWINGIRQTFADSSQRYYTETLEPGAPLLARIEHANYRSATSPSGTVTLYQDEIKLGNSYNAVAP